MNSTASSPDSQFECAEITVALDSSPESPSRARRWAEPFLREHGVNGRAYDILLVLSELVTNAVLHGAGSATVRLQVRPDAVTVFVHDDDPNVVSPRPPRPGEPGGLGLRIVEELASAWGVAPDAEGKSVWALVNR